MPKARSFPDDKSSNTPTSKSSGPGFSTAPTSLDLHSASAKVSAPEPCSRVITAVTPDEPTAGTPKMGAGAAAALTQPSIKTVELASNAKIFIENHFRSVLGNESSGESRKQRLKHLKEYLDFHNASPLERWRYLDQQLRDENKMLRQHRMQLTQEAIIASGKSKTSLQGFEVVRVLGKGSFGVVRLVREATAEGVSESGAVPCEEGKQHKSGVTRRMAASIGIIPSNRRPSQEKKVYAMKVIRKSEMIRSGQEGHIRAERDFLVHSGRSRWVVPLIASFQDQDNLYLVMEFMVGGDFLGFLIKYDRLKEKNAKFYIAEMILAIEETHRLKWIHRDVKPDNFLISSSGHLKISDFGLAFDGDWSHNQRYFRSTRSYLMEKLGIEVKGDLEDMMDDLENRPESMLARLINPLSYPFRGTGAWRRGDSKHFLTPSESEECPIRYKDRMAKRKLAHSIVGTSQYMAPEVIRGEEYDGRCDWWSIGIILYETLYGRTPFLGEGRQQTKQNVLCHRDKLFFPQGPDCPISETARDLIFQLLQEPEDRLTRRSYARVDFEKKMRQQCQSKEQVEAARASWDPMRFGNRDYLGHFVVGSDSEDLKSHAFFAGVHWEHLHTCRPPVVPKIRHGADTRYFEAGSSISDLGESEQDDWLDEKELLAQEAFEQEIANEYERELEAVLAGGQHRGTATDVSPKPPPRYTSKGLASPRRKQKPRARDKVLRDRTVGRKALEYRKRGAFLGYAYRRPVGLGWEWA